MGVRGVKEQGGFCRNLSPLLQLWSVEHPLSPPQGAHHRQQESGPAAPAATAASAVWAVPAALTAPVYSVACLLRKQGNLKCWPRPYRRELRSNRRCWIWFYSGCNTSICSNCSRSLNRTRLCHPRIPSSQNSTETSASAAPDNCDMSPKRQVKTFNRENYRHRNRPTKEFSDGAGHKWSRSNPYSKFYGLHWWIDFRMTVWKQNHKQC